VREEAVSQALQTIERRVNELGVAEPIVARQGAADQILVQLPGVTDVQRAKEIIRSTALLELKLVEQGPFPTEEAAKQAVNNNLPPDMVIVSGAEDLAATGGGTPSTVYYIVRRVAPVTGRDLRNSRPTLDENNLPAVSFTLNQDGAGGSARSWSRTSAAASPFSITASFGDHPVRTDERIAGSFTQQEAQTSAVPHRRPARADGLPRGAHGRADARGGIDPGGRDGLHWGPRPRRDFHPVLLQADRPERGHLDRREPHHPARDDGVSGCDDDAARHRGLHPEMGIGVDSNVLIFERIKESSRLSAACARRSMPASVGSS
jgi:preprotein translocase subunit SecD